MNYLPIQIALGILLSIVACVFGYQFGNWLELVRKNWLWKLKEKRFETLRKMDRTNQLLEIIADRLKK